MKAKVPLKKDENEDELQIEKLKASLKKAKAEIKDLKKELQALEYLKASSNMEPGG